MQILESTGSGCSISCVTSLIHRAAVLEITLAAREQGVVALGLGGIETGFPPELFVDTFHRAEAEGLHRVPHAGEIAGPESVWSAIKLLHAERIEHGVRSYRRSITGRIPAVKCHPTGRLPDQQYLPECLSRLCLTTHCENYGMRVDSSPSARMTHPCSGPI